MGRFADRRLAVIEQEPTPHSGEQRSQHQELSAPQSRALVELDRDWREAFGVPLSESITEGTIQLAESDLLAESEKTPTTMPAPYAPLPPPLPEN